MAQIPQKKTEVSKLAPPGFVHHELLRIDQDFHPNDNYRVCLDAWVRTSDTPKVEAVRMWWCDTGERDIRSPFGRGVTRHIEIEYVEASADNWEVRMRKGKRMFVFEIEYRDGAFVVRGTVAENDNEQVERCRINHAHLVARMLFGLPVGFKGVVVSCTSENGQRHRGELAART